MLKHCTSHFSLPRYLCDFVRAEVKCVKRIKCGMSKWNNENADWKRIKEQSKNRSVSSCVGEMEKTNHLKTNYSGKSVWAALGGHFSWFDIFINIAIIPWLQSTFIPIFRLIYKRPRASTYKSLLAKKFSGANRFRFVSHFNSALRVTQRIYKLLLRFLRVCYAFCFDTFRSVPFKWLNLWIDYRTNWRPGNLYPPLKIYDRRTLKIKLKHHTDVYEQEMSKNTNSVACASPHKLWDFPLTSWFGEQFIITRTKWMAWGAEYILVTNWCD